MNVLGLYHDLKARGVILEADGCESLKVNAPVGAVTEEDRAALRELKPELLKLLSGTEESPEDQGDGRRFKIRRSKYPGYTSLYDPVHDEWHDFPTKGCFPSIVAEAYQLVSRRTPEHLA